MSRSAVSGDLECIYRIGRRGGANVGLQRFAAHYVNGSFEQVGDIGFETGVFPDADRSLRRKVDQDIDIAVGSIVATCEPNNAAWVTPRSRKARSFSRRRSRICCLSMI